MPILAMLLGLQSVPAVTAAPPTPRAATTAAEAPLLRDTRGRPVMTVHVNGKGPFPMVVDTAAQTTLIAAGLARELGLEPLARGIRINGATGTGQGRLWPIDRMANPLIDARRVALVELANSGVTDARGIIGMEQFAGRRLLIDRTGGRIAAMPSGAAGTGFATIAGRGSEEGFVVVPTTLDGVQVPGLVDTGAAVTLVNAAAFRLLGWAEADPRLGDGGTIRGASGAAARIRTARIATLAIGRITLSDVTVMIDDDGNPDPSVILGSDLLNLFPGYAVDFGRKELQIKLPARR